MNVVFLKFFIIILVKLSSVEIHFGFRDTNNVKMEIQMIMMVVLQLAKFNKILLVYQQ